MYMVFSVEAQTCLPVRSPAPATCGGASRRASQVLAHQGCTAARAGDSTRRKAALRLQGGASRHATDAQECETSRKRLQGGASRRASPSTSPSTAPSTSSTCASPRRSLRATSRRRVSTPATWSSSSNTSRAPRQSYRSCPRWTRATSARCALRPATSGLCVVDVACAPRRSCPWVPALDAVRGPIARLFIFVLCGCAERALLWRRLHSSLLILLHFNVSACRERVCAPHALYM